MPTKIADDADFILKRMNEIRSERDAWKLDRDQEQPNPTTGGADVQPTYMGQSFESIEGAFKIGYTRIGDGGGFVEVWDGNKFVSEEEARDKGITTLPSFF